MDNYQDILYNKIINNISKTIKRTLLEQQHTYFLDGLDLDDDGLENRSLINDRINAHQVYHPKTNRELKNLIKELFNKGVNDLNCIDVSNMVDFSNIFEGLTNEIKDMDISEWDVSQGEYFIRMFKNCVMLTCDLSNWKLDNAVNCYEMFHGCINITSEHIPQLTNMKLSEPIKYKVYNFMLDIGCYQAMFELCSSLTEAPKLPATELTEDCYWYMFQGCSQLTEAPELPAVELVDGCYEGMFQSCIQLRYIKAMYIIKKLPTKYMKNWVEGVEYDGTFIINKDLKFIKNGKNGIPAGWKIYTA